MDDKFYHGPAHDGPHFHSGPPGKRGLPGVSPTVQISELSEDGAYTITVTDAYHSESVRIPVADTDFIAERIDMWLDAHPEATTTVEDGSITIEKLTEEAVEELKAIADGSIGIEKLSSTAVAELTAIDDGSIGVDKLSSAAVAELKTTPDGSVTKTKLLQALYKDVGNNMFHFRRIARDLVFTSSASSNVHGGCIIDENNVIMAYLDTNYLSNNTAHIIRYNNTAHTFTEIATLTIGHCDSMSYDPSTGYVYIANAYKAQNGSDVQDPTIYVYDYSDFSLVDTITGLNAHSVYVDRDDGTVYYFTFDNKVKTLTGATLFTFDASWTDSRQGFFVHNGEVYLVTAMPNNLRKYDMAGNILCDIPIQPHYDYYQVGEVEFADVLNDKIIFCGKTDCDDSSERYIQLFQGNLSKNEYQGLYESYHTQTTVHVDASSTAYNPDGRSSNPFKTINEAVLYMCYRNSIEEINLKSGTYKGRFVKSCNIVGNDSSILEPTFKSGIYYVSHMSQINNAVTPGSAIVYTDKKFTSYSGMPPIPTFGYSASVVADTGYTIPNRFNTIRHAIAFCKLEATFSGTGATGWVTILTGLPVPAQNWFFQNVDAYGKRYKLRVNTSGELAINNVEASSSLSIDTTYTYPIVG